jgi:hypothetical protein
MNPLKNTIYKVVEEASGAKASCSLRYGFGIGPSSGVTFNFSGDMRTTSLILGGTMAVEAASPFWPNARTLVIEPMSAWSSRNDHTITVSCLDAQGFSCNIDRIFGIIQGKTFYVSPSGAAENSGRKDEPLDSILDALNMAFLIFPDDPELEIHVAEGKYYSSMIGGYALGVYNAQRLYGGYSPDFTSRDPLAHPTILAGREDESGKGTNTAVFLGGSSSGTLIDGFTVISSSAEGSVGIWLQNSMATVSNNIVNLYSADGIAIYLSAGSAASVSNNTLVNFAAKGSYGILYCDSSDGAVIQNNSISSVTFGEQVGVCLFDSSVEFSGNEVRLRYGENSLKRIALYIVGKTPSIYNNIIDAGTGYETYGIYDSSASPLIFNNTIYAGSGLRDDYGTGSIACAIYNDRYDTDYDPAKPIIKNNLIFSTGENTLVGIKNADSSAPASVSHNCLSGYSPEETALYDATNDIRQNLYNFLDKSDWSLEANAPAAIASGGEDLSSVFSTDRAGAPRPSGAWSMGAYQ